MVELASRKKSCIFFPIRSWAITPRHKWPTPGIGPFFFGVICLVFCNILRLVFKLCSLLGLDIPGVRSFLISTLFVEKHCSTIFKCLFIPKALVCFIGDKFRSHSSVISLSNATWCCLMPNSYAFILFSSLRISHSAYPICRFLFPIFRRVSIGSGLFIYCSQFPHRVFTSFVAPH